MTKLSLFQGLLLFLSLFAKSMDETGSFLEHELITDELKGLWNAQVRESLSDPERRELSEVQEVDLAITVDVHGKNAKELCKAKRDEYCEESGAPNPDLKTECDYTETGYSYIGPVNCNPKKGDSCLCVIYISHIGSSEIINQIAKKTGTTLIDQNSHEIHYYLDDSDNDVEVSDPIWSLDALDRSDDSITDGSFTYLKTDGEGIIVYVLDTGVNNHDDFGDRLVEGANFTDDPADTGTNDVDGHGTHVAGTIAGTKYGPAKAAKIKAVKVLGDDGTGSTQGVINGMQWACEDMAKHNFKGVINMSLGGGKSVVENNALNTAFDSGCIFVVAAGNESSDACNVSPASAEKAITVGAVDVRNNPAWFTNHGPCVDIQGYGVDIISASHRDPSQSTSLSGTSMASPQVAGVVATIMSRHNTVDGAMITNMLVVGDYGRSFEVSGLRPNTVNRLVASPVDGTMDLPDPTHQPTKPPTEPCLTPRRVELHTDDYPDEMDWKITDESEKVICEQSEVLATLSVYVYSCCLKNDVEYTLECTDVHGDGWFYDDKYGKFVIDGKTYCHGFEFGTHTETIILDEYTPQEELTNGEKVILYPELGWCSGRDACIGDSNYLEEAFGDNVLDRLKYCFEECLKVYPDTISVDGPCCCQEQCSQLNDCGAADSLILEEVAPPHEEMCNDDGGEDECDACVNPLIETETCEDICQECHGPCDLESPEHCVDTHCHEDETTTTEGPDHDDDCFACVQPIMDDGTCESVCGACWHSCGYEETGHLFESADECILEHCDDGDNCASHNECGDGEFCYDGHCDTCEECHYCHDGIDGTCGNCGPGYPTQSTDPCTDTDTNCASHNECGDGEFCFDGHCDTCEECHYCHDGIDGTCGNCGPGYPTQSTDPCTDIDDEDETTTSTSTSTSTSTEAPEEEICVNDRCFSIEYGINSYEEAILACAEKGYQIASVHSAEESELIRQIALQNNPDEYWVLLGAQADGNGNWAWTDRSDWDYDHGISPDSGKEEIFLAIMVSDGAWHDLSYVHTGNVACAKDTNTVELPDNLVFVPAGGWCWGRDVCIGDYDELYSMFGDNEEEKLKYCFAQCLEEFPDTIAVDSSCCCQEKCDDLVQCDYVDRLMLDTVQPGPCWEGGYYSYYSYYYDDNNAPNAKSIDQTDANGKKPNAKHPNGKNPTVKHPKGKKEGKKNGNSSKENALGKGKRQGAKFGGFGHGKMKGKHFRSHTSKEKKLGKGNGKGKGGRSINIGKMKRKRSRPVQATETKEEVFVGTSNKKSNGKTIPIFMFALGVACAFVLVKAHSYVKNHYSGDRYETLESSLVTREH